MLLNSQRHQQRVHGLSALVNNTAEQLVFILVLPGATVHGLTLTLTNPNTNPNPNPRSYLLGDRHQLAPTEPMHSGAAVPPALQ